MKQKLKSHGTKKAFLFSLLSVVVCIAMLIGTTFAWFTDSVTSGANKIVAGNLDIEVLYKNTDNAAYVDLQGSQTVFSQGLWEPGHTEYVTLKITNKGTLDCVYKAIVNPVSENGGVNVYGNSFKLSDYLVFGTTTPATEEPSYTTRETAREAVGTVTGLNVGSLTKDSITLKDGETQYITLVVYMPENVGNEANYQTGTQEPSVTLGIQVYATQVEAEADSFGIDYDATAEAAYNTTFAPSYAYFPQVVKTVEKAASGDTTIVQKGNIGGSDEKLVEVVVPEGAVKTGTNELTVKVTPQVPSQATQQSEGVKAEIEDEDRDIANFDVKVEGVKDDNTEDIKVTLYVGTGLSNVKVYHDGALIEGAVYDAVTGYVTFTTKSFSDYTVAYDSEEFIKSAVAKVGANAYETLEEAIAAVSAGGTIYIQKDIIVPLKSATYNNQEVYTLDKSVTIEGNGHSITADADNWALYGGKATGILFTAGSQNGSTYTTPATVNINDLTIVGHENMKHGISVVKSDNANTTLNLNGVTIKDCGANAISVNGTTVNCADVTTSGCAWGGINVDKGGSLAISSGNYDIVYVEGGKAENGTISITGGTFASDPKAYVAKGYYAGTEAPFVVAPCTEHTYEGGVCTKCGAAATGVSEDQKTPIPYGEIIVADQTELDEAMAEASATEKTTIYVGEGTFSINNVDCDNKNIAFVGLGADKTTLQYGSTPASSGGEAGSNYTFEGATVSFADVTMQDVNGNDVNYEGFVRVTNISFKNCIMKSRLTYLGSDTTTFEYCTFETPKYAAWIYGSGTYNFTNCLFNSSTGRFLNIYTDQSSIEPKVNATNCKFVDSSDRKDSNAIFNIKSSAKTTLIINGYERTELEGASALWKVESANGSTITVDGVKVY